MTHGAEHEELLKRVFTSQATADEVRTIEACPDCGPALARLRDAEERASRAGRQFREEWGAARRGSDSTDREQVRQAWFGEVRRRRWRRVIGGLAVAAMVMLAALLFPRESEPTIRREVTLGQKGTLELLAPVGPGDGGAYAPFEWREPQGGGPYRLELFTLEEGLDGVPFRSLSLQSPSWTPSADEERALPPELFWRVTQLDPGSGEGRDSGARHAAR